MTNISSQTSPKEVLFSVYENVSYYQSANETETDSESQPATQPATQPPFNPIDVNFPTRNCIKTQLKTILLLKNFYTLLLLYQILVII